MKSRLAVVARLRELEERHALGAATRALHALLEAEERQGTARRAYDERPVPSGSLSPAGLASLRTQGLGALEAVAEAGAKVGEAQHARTTAEDLARAASIRRRSAERLLERKEAEARSAAAFAAQREADEHTVLRFSRVDRDAVGGTP